MTDADLVSITRIILSNDLLQVAEIIGGYMAGSLAIMADAAHLLTDCISFIVSLVAIWMSGRPPDRRMTFGYKRVGE